MNEAQPLATDGEVRKLDLAAREHYSQSAHAAADAVALAFSRAARRSLPFLTRFKGRILPRPTEMAMRDEPVSGLDDGPMYTVNLAGASGAWATLALSSQAIAMVLEGSLGGRGTPTPGALGPELTAPQKALVGRIARSLAADLGIAIDQVARLEVTVSAEDARKDADKPQTGFRAICDVDGTGVPTALIVTIGAKPFDEAVRESQAREATTADPRIGDSLPEVPLEVIAELGRVSMGLRRVLSLREGDVIRLTTAVDDAVTLRVGGVEKFLGAPITSRGQLAVEIRARHGK
jgi:flagellar motor switch protein FliM